MCLLKKRAAVCLFLTLVVAAATAVTARVRHHHSSAGAAAGGGGGAGGGKQQAIKYLKGLGLNNHNHGGGTNKKSPGNGGMWPSVFNLATKALISSNATCGEDGRREEFCRVTNIGGGAVGSAGSSRGVLRCGICDNFSPDPGKRHPVNYAIDDGTAHHHNRWWQSPSMHYGPQHEYVTVTLDLKQVYQVAYVIVKAANSPRPAAWILERSIDGGNFAAWQYFATSNKDCMDRYGIPARTGKPRYFTDTEVICTTHYSKIVPPENGEIHTFLIHGRPGANETSPELLEFTKARYVRLRLQGLNRFEPPTPPTPPSPLLPTSSLSEDVSRENKRLFYSIRDISVVGQCVCNGHASSCRHNVASGHPECECGHHACGPNCDRCCPLYNQRRWGAATARDPRHCVPCNCHGRAASCHYDVEVDRAGLSMDLNGYFRGGGVCDNCTENTTGINCEKCSPGFYLQPRGGAFATTCVKCDCDPAGFSSTGTCGYDEGIPDDGGLQCDCKLGYAGSRCDACAEGYGGFPQCERCPCDVRGVLSLSPKHRCQTDCVCKANVEGEFCDRCKHGFFSLQANDPDGCLPCYCSGATDICESATSAHVVPKTYQTREGWLLSDISVAQIEQPTWDDERDMISVVGNHELFGGVGGVEAYYWLAPPLYTGNKLESYGSYLTFKVHWVVIRGDTSGKPTTGPDVILVGANGMRIAYGDDHYAGTNMTFRIKLATAEFGCQSWYHVPGDVKDIVTRLRRTSNTTVMSRRDVTTTTTHFSEYRGELVTRGQFLSVLSDVRHVLLRAKFHTDQIEGALEEAVLHCFSDASGLVERCSCPSGYAGLSCESCRYGYSATLLNTTENICIKCECNGHSSTCNPDTGGDCTCEHETAGEACERCAPGFYGNPLLGTSKDCRKCACPLEEPENNFSPSCQLDSAASLMSNDADVDDEGEDQEVMAGYVCTQCPRGYTGDHCEMCDDGHYGVPSQLGGKCSRCSCGGGPCDRITGQCLGCRGNTEGWRCERCKAGHYGDPVTGCEACLCDPLGSKSPDECNNSTGECECKAHFIGRTCNKCQVGYGNVTALCTPCNCNPVGSKTPSSTTAAACDQHSGLCDCRRGVEGFHCDACQHLHYGFSETGCQSCKCNKNGSEISTCDIVTGQCRCKPHYVGRTCHKCEDGFWDSPPMLEGIGGGGVGGCKKCDCDPDGTAAAGAAENNCDHRTGQCACKAGVSGNKCDACRRGFFGFSKNGCKACDVCDKVGHVCDPDTGRCVCPPHSHGDRCDACTPNTWGYEPHKGCKLCNCSETGSVRRQCNPLTGICFCRQGYHHNTGSGGGHYRCDSCEHGYYGYPKCRRCSCSYQGTDTDLGKCENGVCQCDSIHGTCPCKTNVSGKRCNHCKDGTFGLHQENSNGCTRCFCFGRSTVCREAGYTWGKIRAQNRTLTVDFIDNYPNNNNKQNYRDRVTSNDILDLNNFEEIEGTAGDLTRTHDHFDVPLYWKLPDDFTGDRILSYGGYFRFQITTITVTQNLDNKNHRNLEDDDSKHHRNANVQFGMYPLVWIEGNGIKLYHEVSPHSPSTATTRTNHEIRVHESGWRCAHTPTNAVTRELLMMTLQNVSSIYVKASDYSAFERITLSGVSLDGAVEVPGSPPPLALGVEKCECPREYGGTSCQNPSQGYFRHRTPITNVGSIVGGGENHHHHHHQKTIDAVVGKSKPCECNGRSMNCDRETGECLNCTMNTAGRSCERCAEGHYGDPMQLNVTDSVGGGKCIACPCPSPSQNFAISCTPPSPNTPPHVTGHHFTCTCKKGYTGAKCDRCSGGHYGQPHLPTEGAGGGCRPCNCNRNGRLLSSKNVDDECDEVSGECSCKRGITGPKCSLCERPRHVLQEDKCVPCDICIQILLDDIDHMTADLKQNTTHLFPQGHGGAILQPPWQTLEAFRNRYERLENHHRNFSDNRNQIHQKINNNNQYQNHNKNTTIDNYINKNENDHYHNELSLFESDVDFLRQILKSSNSSLMRITDEGNRNADRSEVISADVKRTNRALRIVMTSLENFGSGGGGKNEGNGGDVMSVGEALRRGEELLEKIKGKVSMVEGYRGGVQIIADTCQEVYDEIQTMAKASGAKAKMQKKTKDELYSFSARLFQFEQILSDIVQKQKQLLTNHKANLARYKQLQLVTLTTLETHQKQVQDKLKLEKRLVADTMSLLDTAEDNYGKFQALKADLDGLNRRVEEKADGLDASIDLLEVYRDEVDAHTADLRRNVTDYKSAFHLSNRELNAVNASGRFDQIVKQLTAANTSVHETKTEFDRLLSSIIAPVDGRDSIYDDTSIATADADRLVKRVHALEKQLKSYKDRAHRYSSIVDGLEASNWQNGLSNNENNRLARIVMKTDDLADVYGRIDAHMQAAVVHSENMRHVYKDAMNINISMQYGLVKDYRKYLTLTSAENVKNFQEKIKVTRDLLLHNITSKTGSSAWTDMDSIRDMNGAVATFQNKRDAVHAKLQQLKVLVERTQQMAHIIQVAMNGSSCSRSYTMPDMEPSIITNIKVHFTTSATSNNNKQRDGDDDTLGGGGGLVYISNGAQYLSLQVVNRIVQFKWNLGDGEGGGVEESLASKVSIGGTDSDQDVKISIRRISSHISMKVNDEIISNYTRPIPFRFTAAHLLHVGLLHHQNKNINSGLPGCIKDIVINERRVGLWYFHETKGGCTGCYRNNTVQEGGGSKYRFDGRNCYVKEDEQASKNCDPRHFNVKFKMRTFDENALLFLAHHEGTYMSVVLRERRLYCELHYKNRQIEPIILTTTDDQEEVVYNNGRQVQVDCSKVYQDGVDRLLFKINNDDSIQANRTITSSDLLKIKKSVVFYGGVSPDFDFPGGRIESFLGVLDEISLSSRPLSLATTRHHGVEPMTSDDIAYCDVTFQDNHLSGGSGGGYLTLADPTPPPPLTTSLLTQINFMVSTPKTSTKFEGLVLAVDRARVAFWLRDGRITVDYFNKKQVLQSAVIDQDQEFCLVNLRLGKVEKEIGGKQKQLLTLFVNGVEQMRTTLPTTTLQTSVSAYLEKGEEESNGGKYYVHIGGTKGGNNRFTGTVKDVILTYEDAPVAILYVTKETYVDARNARIGRQTLKQKTKQKWLSSLSSVPNSNNNNKHTGDGQVQHRNDDQSHHHHRHKVNVNGEEETEEETETEEDVMQQTDDGGCDKISYTLEPDAVKFGDAADSFVVYYIKESFWRSDYSIQFEFRTFYADGLLFLSHGAREHFTLLEVKDGLVQMYVKGKKSKRIVISGSGSTRVDDGNWHRIALHRGGGSGGGGRKGRRVAVTLDEGRTKRVKMPSQNRIAGKLYFGDMARSGPDAVPRRLVDELQHQRPFRGCVRSLKINGAPRGIVVDNNNNNNSGKNTVVVTQHNNIGQCFPSIERGSYFRGDSYAVYDSSFTLSDRLQLSFSFRTGEQNGIFLSISHIHNNSPALSVELQNGAVVMSVDMGHNNNNNGGGSDPSTSSSSSVTNVSNRLTESGTVCDNRWHRVRATVGREELTVSVDGVSQSWVLSDVSGGARGGGGGGFLQQIMAPLYIGGLPDWAAGGTLKIRENFKGCIDNFTIIHSTGIVSGGGDGDQDDNHSHNNKHYEKDEQEEEDEEEEEVMVDWREMEELNNVSLNSCPL